ncbi:hypothetical protein GOBAR_AA37045 [Gossypium barbadense]|uniref:Glutamine amidotransferase domain-containing protein n=1 Tax=Gossypium barbadense TaxID=3634 RepID=A0A2P5VXX4_GOSBA|nr:hypothetical protein GOBAR_AA37045 [Gossypium barbadense]
MAVNFVMQSSLIQPKPSLSLKTLQNPSLPQLSRLASPSTSSAVPDSAFSVLETKQDSQNPIILIDNYDSFFTSNLCQIWYLGELGCSLKVCRNDELTVEELKRKNPRGVVSSPGPGKTVRSPYGLKLGDSCLRKLGCLQDFRTNHVLNLLAIEKLVGIWSLLSMLQCLLGKLKPISLTENCTLLPSQPPLAPILSAILPFQAGRCPGAFLDMDGFPLKALKVTAFTEDGLIMAARHKIYKYLHMHS